MHPLIYDWNRTDTPKPPVVLLDDETLRVVAVMKLEGHSHAEIAGRLRCSVRTVERKLALIRERWQWESNR